jgi:SAM-dependent methyltransferase
MIKEIDIEGEDTLNAIAKADKFNFWMYSQMRPYLRGNILEIGSGIGNISDFLTKEFPSACLSDVRDQYTEYLKQRFPNNNVLNIDLVHPEFETVYQELLGSFDFVFALNVVEHIKDDSIAASNMAKLLKPNGKMFILVPAYQRLYNSFDVALEHFRRYNKEKIGRLNPKGCEPIQSRYFNAFGILGWFIVGSIFKKKIIPEGNMSLFNKIVPMVKLFDWVLGNRIGLSVILVTEKTRI